MSERHRDKYHLAVLSPNLTYESPIPMSLEEFGHHHPEAKKLENQEAKGELERLLESLKLFMGYYAL